MFKIKILKWKWKRKERKKLKILSTTLSQLVSHFGLNERQNEKLSNKSTFAYAIDGVEMKLRNGFACLFHLKLKWKFL